MRYNQLIPLIEYHKPKTIVEVGTWNGFRAIMMATEALKHHDEIEYYGFDLFEDATDETDEKELNVKKHYALADVESRLEDFQKKNPGFKFCLVKGDTRETLKKDDWLGDFAFIDGGHSIETIRNDYEALKNSKIVVLDDFYKGLDTEKFGCNSLLKEVDHLVLPQADPVKGGGKVQMAVIPPTAWPAQNIVIKTKNCVPDEEIQANIRYSLEKFANWVEECSPNQETAIMVSGGPSFEEHLEEIRSERGYVVCVKHAHDILIENGIVPWGCMLLDPRDHVRDFVENPHPNVIYFTATMCHPSTVDRLIEKEARIVGYNAHVGAGEETVLKNGHIMIGGGSTSAIRGISVLQALGFRKFKLYGYDSCYPTPQDKAVLDKMGRPKYFKVKACGQKFWTDHELVAQFQDFTKLVEMPFDLDIEVVGEGMIKEAWKLIKPKPSFRDILHG